MLLLIVFEFVDNNGPGFCQLDLLLSTVELMIILEAKYTWVESGHRQLEELYIPVVERIFSKKTLGIVVCKNLTPETSRFAEIFPDLAGAIRWVRQGGKRAVWHCLT